MGQSMALEAFDRPSLHSSKARYVHLAQVYTKKLCTDYRTFRCFSTIPTSAMISFWLSAYEFAVLSL